MESDDGIRESLQQAISLRDTDAFERAMTSACRDGVPRSLAATLARALVMPWHTRHEDVARALQQLKDPVAVGALYEAALAKHAYLDYDEFFGLARKCTWALADIGTPEAKLRLEQLAAGGNEAIAAYARKRLARWEEEKERKGVPMPTDAPDATVVAKVEVVERLEAILPGSPDTRPSEPQRLTRVCRNFGSEDILGVHLWGSRPVARPPS
jgi:hypothetical protein